MGFKRAEWHSGLTYRQTCRECKATIEYTDEILDFRPWFADGFVYCPQCNTPLRHSENYAINNPHIPNISYANNQATQPQQTIYGGKAKFCTKCGYPFGDIDLFCSQCGNKR